MAGLLLLAGLLFLGAGVKVLADDGPPPKRIEAVVACVFVVVGVALLTVAATV